MKVAASILVLSLLASSWPSTAQTTQTVAGAQEFLAVQARSDRVSAFFETQVTRHHSDGTSQQYYMKLWPKIARMEIATIGGVRDECVTMVTATYSDEDLSQLRTDDPSGMGRFTESYAADRMQPRQPLDWRKVTIERLEGRIWVGLGDAGMRAVNFKTAETALLDRIEYAARFLQMSCDPAASTGF